MKSNENKDLSSVDKIQQGGGERDAQNPQEAVKGQALAALHALSLGERPALSPEKSEEAAGLLGNQNVLKLMEKGEEMQRALAESETGIDTHALFEVLSGPPDGPVCAMETLFFSGQ